MHSEQESAEETTHNIVPRYHETWTYAVQSYNEIRDLTATLLTEVCSQVAVEPELQPVSQQNYPALKLILLPYPDFNILRTIYYLWFRIILSTWLYK